MGRLCERPGCSDVAAMSYGFDADRLLVWLAPREADADPLRAGGLCKRHADAMVVPRGWTLDDRRERTPRLFRPAPASDPGAAGRGRAARRPEPGPPSEQLALGARPADAPDDDAAPTVADVAGPSPSEDPDETRAIPWLPDVDDDDEDDDLGGVLSADSPLLARAFRGTDRPRD
jgi:hypothetical protein